MAALACRPKHQPEHLRALALCCGAARLLGDAAGGNALRCSGERGEEVGGREGGWEGVQCVGMQAQQHAFVHFVTVYQGRLTVGRGSISFNSKAPITAPPNPAVTFAVFSFVP